MDCYLDIKILPDDDIPIYFIRNKVYTKFHKALSTLNSNDIGVSFPNYKVKLGNVIRLHGTESRLSELQNTSWLGGLSGYCEVTEIKSIPSGVSYRKVSRKQANMTASKLRRLVKRGTISADEEKQYKAKMFTQGLDNPFLELESSSNGHKHRRYLEFGEIIDTQVNGQFDQFGLSKTATVPWF